MNTTKIYYKSLNTQGTDLTNPRNREIYTISQAIQPLNVTMTEIQNFTAILANSEGILIAKKFGNERQTREIVIADSINTEANKLMITKYLKQVHDQHIAEMEAEAINKALIEVTLEKATGATLIEQIDSVMNNMTAKDFYTFQVIVTPKQFIEISQHVNDHGFYKNSLKVTVADVVKSFVGEVGAIHLNHDKAPAQRSQATIDEQRKGLTTFFSICHVDAHVLNVSKLIEIGVTV